MFPSERISVGQSVGMAVFDDLHHIVKVQWDQTDGTPVTLFSPDAKVIAPFVSAPGYYRFVAEMTFEDGVAETEVFEFEAVEAETASPFYARLDRTAVMGQTVSLRAMIPSPASGRIVWKNLNVPAVRFVQDASDPALIHVPTPSVQKDTLLVFQATLEEEGVSDSVMVLVEPARTLAEDPLRLFQQRVARTHPYRPDADYRDELTYCTYSNDVFIDTTCSFQKLPLLGMQFDLPDKASVMSRVVVSHDWMGQRFEEFLDSQEEADDFYHLFRSVTAIVISEDLSGSYFDGATGALYLRPKILALTPEERATILEPEAKDNPWSALNFVTRWRYVVDDAPVLSGGDLSLTSGMTYRMEQVQYEIARTLFHELAHAADFFPSDALSGISDWQHPWDFVADRIAHEELASSALAIQFPISEAPVYDVLHGLATMVFSGASPDSLPVATRQVTAQEYAYLFSRGHGMDLYAFTDSKEDFALLYEAAMMQIRYGAVREVGVFEPGNPESVVWGQAGRVGNAQVKPRAVAVMTAIRKDVDAEILLDQLPEESTMVAGAVWSKSGEALAAAE